jgi:hypothetical protein
MVLWDQNGLIVLDPIAFYIPIIALTNQNATHQNVTGCQ